MATRPVVPQPNRGGAAAVGKQKVMGAAEGKNRKALGDIGNLVYVRNHEGKQQQQISRPITRSFCAQLLANAQAAAAPNKKPDAVVAEIEAKTKPVAEVAVKQGATAKLKPEPKTVIDISPDSDEGNDAKGSSNQKDACRKSSKKKTEAFTTVLSARSKMACGIRDIDDIDSADSEDQRAVVEYIEDIYKFYRLMEDSSRVPEYMKRQTEINERMRSILIDWLIEVHNKFELMPETLYLTVHIVDSYLSKQTVIRRELQLVGVCAMLIASKYEEIWAPEVNDFVHITDMAYTREAILRMEKLILNELDWSLTVPTPYVYLVRFLKAAKSDKEMEHMVFFFSELALMQYSTMMTFSPSMIAASAIYAAQCTLKKSALWSKTLRHHTGYTEEQIMDCVKLLLKLHSSAKDSNLKVVCRKYTNPELSAVALFPPAPVSLLKLQKKVNETAAN